MAAHKLRFGLLGPVEVHLGDEPVEVPGRKPRALLALLLLHANEVVPRERLIDGLWGESPPEHAANALQVHVHALRKALGADRVRTEGTGYRIVVEPDELDVARFARLVEARRFADALAEWRGAPLAGLEEEPFASGEVARLDEARLEAVEGRIAAELDAGRIDGVVGELEALVAANPYRESLRGQLMRALYAAGRQAEALDAYRDARRVLRDELGLEPGRELQELEARILRQDPSLVASSEPQVELPEPPTPLVGRELERVAVAALVRDPRTRLLTLTGPGGTGKTRLAIAAAQEVAAELDRVAFVDLAPLDSHELVVSAITSALGLAEGPETSPVDVLVDAVGDRRTLLVLDNFEHVADAAPAIGVLLGRLPALKVLATSRAPLRLAAEHEYPVPPLEQSEALLLFVGRAAAAGVTVSPGDPAVAEICDSLDRLPLALELAAARTRLLSLADLRRRLDRRLELLTAGARDAPARHRALRATIDWSYELLGEAERGAFARLEPFAGSFTIADAEAVVQAPVDVLSAVVDAGLAVRTAEGRVRVLETVREYAADLLSDAERTETRFAHARHYLAVAERHAPALRGTGAEPALAAIELEYDNFRVALAFLREHDELVGYLRLIRALDRFWYVRGFLAEGRGWIDAGLERSEGLRTSERGLVLKSASLISWRQGDHDLAERYADEARVLLGELGDEGELVGALILLGAIAHSREQFDRAAPLYDEAMALARRNDRPFELALVLTNAAGIAARTGDAERRDAMYEEAQQIARSIDATELVAFTSIGLAWRSLTTDDLDGLERHASEGLDLLARLGFRDRMATCCLYLAELALRKGEHERSARLLGASTRLRGDTGGVAFYEEVELEQAAVAALRAELGDARFESTFAEGEQGPDQVVTASRARR